MEAQHTSDTNTEANGVTIGIDALTETDNVKTKPEDETTSKQTSKSGFTSSCGPPTTARNTACQNDSKAESHLKHGSQDYLSPKKSRRVSFPLDTMVVSGYMDPPNPWNDGESSPFPSLICLERSWPKSCHDH